MHTNKKKLVSIWITRFIMQFRIGVEHHSQRLYFVYLFATKYQCLFYNHYCLDDTTDFWYQALNFFSFIPAGTWVQFLTSVMTDVFYWRPLSKSFQSNCRNSKSETFFLCWDISWHILVLCDIVACTGHASNAWIFAIFGLFSLGIGVT